MIDVKKIDTEGEEFKDLQKEHFFQNMDMAEIVDNASRLNGISVYVAEENDIIVGYALSEMTNDKVVELLSIAVSEEYRSRGAGTDLIKYIFNDYKPKAMVAMVPKNCVEFFEKNGFNGMELGENINGLETYYMTYRAV